MKTAFLILLCHGVASLVDGAGHIDILAALHKGVPEKKGFDFLGLLHHKKQKKAATASDDPTGMLSSIMAASAQGLATAQQAHEKAVKQARVQITTLLQKQGAVLSHAIGQLDSDLAESSMNLEVAKNASENALEKAKAAPTNVRDWDSAAELLQARAGSQIASAERTLRKSERERQFAIKDSLTRAGQLLEDGVRKLSHKVGDLREVVKPVQTSIEQDHTDGYGTVNEPKAKPALLQKSAASTDLNAAGAALLAAGNQVSVSKKAAQKNLDVAFDTVQKDLASAAKAISDALDGEQEQELKGVRSAVSTFGTEKAQKKKKLYHWRKHHA